MLDIEVSPTLATVWGLFQQNIAINQLIGNSEVLTWAARWLHEPSIMDGSLLRDGKRRMLKRIHALLCKADAVITWNGNDFDLKILNKEFMLLRLPPPAPYKSVDLLAECRAVFRFTSNKMDFVAKQLGVKCKVRHRGHEMWLDCMSKKPSAFREMLFYNRGDIVTLAGIHKRMAPWVRNPPNRYLYAGAPNITDPARPPCPDCGGRHVVKVKDRVKKTRTTTQWQCQSKKCGRYFTPTTASKKVGRRALVAA